MLKLLIGVKGTGKTKTLIEKANEAIDTTKGAVVCIEKGTKLIHEINYRVRLVDTDEYKINDAKALYGMVAGVFASNHDVTHIFIDSALKICKNDVAAFEEFVALTAEFAEVHNIEFLITASLPAEEASESLKKYL